MKYRFAFPTMPPVGWSLAIVGTLMLAIASNAQAQNPSPGLQDLVGARGRDGERILEERGYEFRWADKSSGSDVYTYWTNYSTGECVTVRTEEGRYASLVTAPAFDCDQGDPGHAQSTTPSGVDRRLADLIGVRASSGEQALEDRGYTYANGEQLDNGVATYWIEGSTGDCVEVITSNGVYTEIFEAEWYYCQPSGSQ
ncbi:hypothetical protein IQ254_24030 [Nodosilinea sp. LEGE 07088]|uniref:hypothetical protein n=1 Tax=Nodosilinea sp. LEGE 07088 TaxID=2777968 RepID=UPI00187E36F6|nr:hypothetical protein [Nodosilinea sp. LEGE 07088]MBE9140231.1 hypothetical protein [Nodosilinea sp. LEGE 07088]